MNLLDAAGNAERCVTTPACEATPTPPRRNTDAKTSSRNGSAMRSPTASRLRRLPAVSPHAIGMCRNFPYEVKAARKRAAPGRTYPGGAHASAAPPGARPARQMTAPAPPCMDRPSRSMSCRRSALDQMRAKTPADVDDLADADEHRERR
ncbi:hypothetical protein ACFQZ4_53385 [Catellatospora coxensis]